MTRPAILITALSALVTFMLSGCSLHTYDTGSRTIRSEEVKLPDGRFIICLKDGAVGGLSCDWLGSAVDTEDECVKGTIDDE